MMEDLGLDIIHIVLVLVVEVEVDGILSGIALYFGKSSREQD